MAEGLFNHAVENDKDGLKDFRAFSADFPLLKMTGPIQKR